MYLIKLSSTGYRKRNLQKHHTIHRSIIHETTSTTEYSLWIYENINLGSSYKANTPLKNMRYSTMTYFRIVINISTLNEPLTLNKKHRATSQTLFLLTQFQNIFL